MTGKGAGNFWWDLGSREGGREGPVSEGNWREKDRNKRQKSKTNELHLSQFNVIRFFANYKKIKT